MHAFLHCNWSCLIFLLKSRVALCTMASNRFGPKKPLEPAGPPPTFEHYRIKVKMIMATRPETFKIGKEFEMYVGPMTTIGAAKAKIFQMIFEGGIPREGRNWDQSTLIMRLARTHPDTGLGEYLDDDRMIKDYNPPGINYGLPFNGSQLMMMITMRISITTPKGRRFTLNWGAAPGDSVSLLKRKLSTKVQELGGVLEKENMRITFMGNVLEDKWAMLYDVGMGNNGDLVEVGIEAIEGGGEWEDGMPKDHEGEIHPHDKVHCLSYHAG
jgi:hypothetical protein